MYNLDVAIADTFYVGDGQWLVHNANVCPFWTVKDGNGRVTDVVANLDKAFINGGTKPTTASQNWTAANGLPSDDPGHILARVLGGPGGIRSDNIVPIDITLNRGALSSLEKQLASRVSKNGDNVSVHIQLVYGNATLPNRPTQIVYNYSINNGPWVSKPFTNP